MNRHKSIIIIIIFIISIIVYNAGDGSIENHDDISKGYENSELKVNDNLLKDNYYTDEFKTLQSAYEEKFGPLIVWIIPKDETFESFKEKINVSLEKNEDVIVISYDNEEEFKYWKDIVNKKNANEMGEYLEEDNIDVYNKLVKDCYDTDEFKLLANKYKNKFPGQSLIKSIIPENETMRDLSEKIEVSIQGGWDILPPSYNWENENVNFWTATKEFEDLEQFYIEENAKQGIKKFTIDVELMVGSYYNMYDYIHGTNYSSKTQPSISYGGDLKNPKADY